MLMGTDIFHSCQLVKQVILPRIHGLALKTTVAAVCIFLILTLLFYLFWILFGRSYTFILICDRFFP